MRAARNGHNGMRLYSDRLDCGRLDRSCKGERGGGEREKEMDRATDRVINSLSSFLSLQFHRYFSTSCARDKSVYMTEESSEHTARYNLSFHLKIKR